MTSSRRSKFIDPALLDEAVAQVDRLARHEHVRVALIGGLAMQIYGSDRLTKDVDFAAENPIQALPPGEPLTFGGMMTAAPNGVPVDLVLRDDEFAPLYEEAIDSAVRVKGVASRVVRPEHLAAMKMCTGRHGKDDDDLEFLVTSGAIDLDATRKIIRQHLGPYAVREFNALVEEALWRKSRRV